MDKLLYKRVGLEHPQKRGKNQVFGPPPGRILYLEILRFPSFSISITLRFMRQNVFQVFFPGNSVRFTSKWFAEATVWTSSQRNDGMLCVSSRDHPQFAFAALLLIILRFIFLYQKIIESEKHWAVLFLLGEDVVKHCHLLHSNKKAWLY